MGRSPRLVGVSEWLMCMEFHLAAPDAVLTAENGQALRLANIASASSLLMNLTIILVGPLKFSMNEPPLAVGRIRPQGIESDFNPVPTTIAVFCEEHRHDNTTLV
ncbi:hypothetical protein J6590_083781 [Homalodisca vitripennis]|nr:hypothetical protein J6590_083781 [Homalodisca vitripennis]